MFKALKRLFISGDSSDSSSNAALPVETLNISNAIAAHENWKIRLEAYLEGNSSEDMRPELICFDDRCDLGKWLHGTGSEYFGKFRSFRMLVSDHRDFHYAASNVVALSKAGKVEQARAILSGPFAEHSKKVVSALHQLKKVEFQDWLNRWFQVGFAVEIRFFLLCGLGLAGCWKNPLAGQIVILHPIWRYQLPIIRR